MTIDPNFHVDIEHFFYFENEQLALELLNFLKKDGFLVSDISMKSDGKCMLVMNRKEPYFDDEHWIHLFEYLDMVAIQFNGIYDGHGYILPEDFEDDDSNEDI